MFFIFYSGHVLCASLFSSEKTLPKNRFIHLMADEGALRKLLGGDLDQPRGINLLNPAGEEGHTRLCNKVLFTDGPTTPSTHSDYSKHDDSMCRIQLGVVGGIHGVTEGTRSTSRPRPLCM